MGACWEATIMNGRRKYLQVSKKTSVLASTVQKLTLEGFRWDGTPKWFQNICFLNSSQKLFKKLIFGGPFGKEFPGGR